MKNIYKAGGYSNNWNVLPFGEGLTHDTAEARNPLSKIPYKAINQIPSSDYAVSKSTDLYYMVQYKHMKVCACVLACGLNGFEYAMLWQQYKNKNFYLSLKSLDKVFRCLDFQCSSKFCCRLWIVKKN